MLLYAVPSFISERSVLEPEPLGFISVEKSGRITSGILEGVLSFVALVQSLPF